MHGQGEYQIDTEKTYSGEFVNSIFEGKGILKTGPPDKQEIYSGTFNNGKINGEVNFYIKHQGEYCFLNGDRYIGQFINEKREGSGTQIYACGNIYKGQFVDGIKHGTGEFTDVINNECYKGIFVIKLQDPISMMKDVEREN